MALDNFIPKNSVKLCNKCRKKSLEKPFTCQVYPEWIPDEMLTGDCPDFELDEQKVKEQEAWKREVRKMTDEMVARAKKRQSEKMD